MKLVRGFTLIELLVVISIIGMLASVVLASLNSARTKALDAKRLSDMRQIVNALELYALDHNGNYPSTGSASGNVVKNWAYSYQTQPWIPGLTSQYISTVPIDPKNTHPSFTGASTRELFYYYESDGSVYCIQISQEGDTGCSPSNSLYWGFWGGGWREYM
jgi:type II secretion system protein G